MRALPTLLGALLLLAGLIAFSRSQQPSAAPPEQVTLEPLPTTPFRAVLFGQLGDEVRSRELELRAADAPSARLGATLRALRSWLREASLWPAELGAPHVFWLGEGRAALDFPLRGAPSLSVSAEVRLLESIHQTAARQGVDSISILVNGRLPPTFLGQVALPQTLED